MFCMNCGQKLPEGAKFCKRCGTPLGAVSPDGVYTPDSDEDEVSASEGPKLGSFSVDGEDTGERLPQRSESSNNYFSMMGSANSNSVPPKEQAGPSPFKHTADKKEEPKAATPSAFKPAAPAKEEAPKPAATPSAFKPATPAKEEPKPATPSAFKPAVPAKEEPKPATPSAFKPAASEKKEEAPKPAPASSAPISSAFKPIEKKEEKPEKKPAEKKETVVHKKEPFEGAFETNEKKEVHAEVKKPDEAKKNTPSPDFLKRLGLTQEDIEPAKDNGVSSSLPMGSDDYAGPKLGSLGYDGDNSGAKLGSFGMDDDNSGAKLGSFSVDGDDTGETLPQRDSGNNYYSMMGSISSLNKPNPSAEEAKTSSAEPWASTDLSSRIT